MEANQNENGHKKYLVPLVALLLCAVACVGVGYAYYSVNNTDGNVLTNDAEILTLTDAEGAITNKAVQFDVDYIATVSNGTLGVAVDNAHSTLSKIITLNLASSTGVAKNVTIAPVSIASIGGVTYAVSFYKVDSQDEKTGEAISSIEVAANSTAKVLVELTVNTSGATSALATTASHVSPAFTLTFTTADATHAEA